MKKQTKNSSAGKETDCCPSIEDCDAAVLSRVRRILVPVDFSEESERALRCATRLAEQRRASINLLYGLETMDDLKNEAADLIIISTRERRGESTTEQVVRHAPCPVLVVRKNRTLLRFKHNGEFVNKPQSPGDDPVNRGVADPCDANLTPEG